MDGRVRRRSGTDVERWTNKHKSAETSHLYVKLINLYKKNPYSAEERHYEKYLFGGVGGGQVFLHLLLHRLTDVVVCRILKVGLYLVKMDGKTRKSFLFLFTRRSKLLVIILLI